MALPALPAQSPCLSNGIWDLTTEPCAVSIRYTPDILGVNETTAAIVNVTIILLSCSPHNPSL